MTTDNSGELTTLLEEPFIKIILKPQKLFHFFVNDTIRQILLYVEDILFISKNSAADPVEISLGRPAG